MKVLQNGMNLGSFTNKTSPEGLITIMSHCDSSGQRGRSCTSGQDPTIGNK